MTKELLQQALDALLGYKPQSLTHAKEQDAAVIALREAIAQPAAKVTCQTCEALARTVMMDQTYLPRRHKGAEMTQLPTPSAWRYRRVRQAGGTLYIYSTRFDPADGPDYVPMYTQGQLNQYGQACFVEGCEAQPVRPAPERNAITAAAYMQIAEDYRKVLDDTFSGADVATWCELAAQEIMAGQPTVQPVHVTDAEIDAALSDCGLLNEVTTAGEMRKALENFLVSRGGLPKQDGKRRLSVVIE